MNANLYSIVIKYVPDDCCFEAKVLELPDVAEYADTYQEAYDLAVDTIETTADIMAKKGKTMPAPLCPSEEEYSGRVTLRLPKSLHATMAKMADREGTSLNQLLCSVLSAHRGFDAGMGETVSNWSTIANTFTATRSRKRLGERVVLRLSEHKGYQHSSGRGWSEERVACAYEH